MRRRLLTLVGVASGALAGAGAYRRWFGARRGRIDVHFEDGSFVTFVAGSREADRLLPLADQVRAAAKSS